MDPSPVVAAASSSTKPAKGILKNRSSTSAIGLAGAESSASLFPATLPYSNPNSRRTSEATGVDDPGRKKSQKWDEMNILATYHPAGKDYGLMKIDEPSTPYHSMRDEEDAGSDTEGSGALTADILAKKLSDGTGPKILAQQESSDEEEDEEEELTLEELEKKKQFEMKRKRHYNEGQNIKLARQLIEKELRGDAAGEEEEEEEDEEEEEEKQVEDQEMVETANSDQMCPNIVPAPTDPLENVPRS